MKMKTKEVVFAAAAAACALPLFAKIELGTPFSDHAVLQRGMKAPVWGRAAAGSEVTVAFADQVLRTVADADGRWRVDLAPMEASKESRSLTATETADGRAVDAVTVKDVLVGEVWFASGQSNMSCPLWCGNTRFRDGNGALLVIDKTTLIHVGASLNHLGKKCFAFSSLDKSNIPDILAKI